MPLMNPAEITAVGASLASLAGVLKVLFDSRVRDKKLSEQFDERRDERKHRYGDIMFERLSDEVRRLDAKIATYETRHQEDQRRIVELEQGRMRREIQLAELGARISNVDNKVDTLQTGIFAKFDRGELNDK